MRFFVNARFALLVAAMVGLPSAAQAQYPFRTFGGGYFGNYGGYGFGGPGAFSYGNLGGLGYGYPGYWSPYGVSGLSSPYYNSGLMYSSPYYSNGYNRAGSVIYPGFGASEMPRVRNTLYPAIAEPSQQTIFAALVGGDDKDKARIDLHLPTADAKVYLDGTLTQQGGMDRTYATPKLTAGKRYAFNMEVVWTDESGMQRRVQRHLRLCAGETTSVNLQETDE